VTYLSKKNRTIKIEKEEEGFNFIYLLEGLEYNIASFIGKKSFNRVKLKDVLNIIVESKIDKKYHVILLKGIIVVVGRTEKEAINIKRNLEKKLKDKAKIILYNPFIIYSGESYPIGGSNLLHCVYSLNIAKRRL